MVFDQENRICRMASSSGLDGFGVRRFRAREAVSEPFRADLELVSADPEVDLEKMLGASVTVTIDTASGDVRHFNGVVDAVRLLDVDLNSAVYHLELAPWTRLLELRTNCRVFQDASALEIVDKILGEHPVSDVEQRLSGGCEVRPYCVQYRESDWAFVARLLEEEGIAYHFEHADGRHVLVLCDDPGQRKACQEHPTVLFRTAEDTDADGDTMLEEAVKEFHLERSLQHGARMLADFNYLDPNASLQAQAPARLAVQATKKLEDFEYPAGFVKLGAEGDAKLPFGETMVGVRTEAIDARTLLGRGMSNCRGLTPGSTFEFVNHPRRDCRINWMLLAVETDFDQTGTFGAGGAGSIHHANAFICLPAEVPYRPARRTARPVVKGPQTAIVTGPSGEEIHTDAHGRVKVAFHWDREAPRDGTDTCWVRVAHGWAGSGWGVQFTPRIGHEVVVEFLEGDPDRPLITGSVYNGKNAIPFATPTQSGVRTRSSKEGGAANCNEIRFEDKKGSEDLFMQAERTLTVNVKASSSKMVGTDQTLNVGKSRTVSVENNESVSVGENQSVNVGDDQTVTVGGQRSLSVGKDLNVSVGEKCSISVGKSRSLSVGTSATTAIGKDDSVNVGGNRNLTVKGEENRAVDKNSITKVKDGYKLEAKKIAIEAKDELVIKVGKATLEMKKNGDIKINGKKIDIKGSGDVVIKGSKIGGN